MILKQGKQYSVQLIIRSPHFEIGEGEVDDILADALDNAKIELVQSMPYIEESEDVV